MRLSRRRVGALSVAFVLAAAAPAGAQSAGDDQYEDPFAGQDGGSEQTDPGGGSAGGGSNGSSAGGTTGTSDSGTAGSPGGAVTESSGGEATGSSGTASTAQPASAQQLPLTGVDAGLVALAGTVLLAGGVALRVRERRGRPRLDG